MRPTWSFGVCAAALVLAACTDGCKRTGSTESARRRLDYAPFMKASGEALAAAFAGHLGVALAPSSAPDGGSGKDHDVHAVAGGGIIKLSFDRHRRPLTLHYRAPAGCPGRKQAGATPLTPPQANARVLSLLRRMGYPIDDTVAVESQLHQDAFTWLGVNVRQTYRGELVELPKVFVLVDGISGQVCEMQLGRWYVGLDALGPPLPVDALLSRARQVGKQPSLRALRIVDDTLCRVVKLANAPDQSLCLDVVTGAPAEP